MATAPLLAASRKLTLAEPLPLDGGQALAGAEIAYETIGTLNADKTNAILVCHALTMDQHFASLHPKTGKPGWWAKAVGPGNVVDTDRFFVICANVLGGCMGSTGPASLAPDGAPFAMRFPVITIRDMVRAQIALLDALGIERLHAVVGGSMGGMQALSLAANFPERTAAALVIASTARHSAQNI
ncbi:MAG: alpha/beta fold hydrolase, partial [Novosphingobium sp.]